MPVKMRLQRRGRGKRPFYHIVIADGRAPRDGKFIEKIGTYNPITVPADIELDFEKALDWLKKGAQPTNTVKNILSYKGVLYKYHLLKGVTKGAHSEEKAEEIWRDWFNEKMNKINKKKNEQELKLKEDQKEKISREKKINEEKAAELAKKRTEEVEEQVKAAQEQAAANEEKHEEAEVRDIETPPQEKAEEAKTDEKKEEVKPEQPKEEAKKDVKKEEPKEEVKKEEPKAEEKKEEEKAEEKKEEPKKEEKKEDKSEDK